MPKVSVIIPVYNTEKYLRKCLDSVVNQTLKDIEIICVNDGSPDNSLAILEEYAQNDNRIKIINKSNGGLSSARNAGLEISQGEFIGFVDSDDWIEPETYELAFNAMNDYNPDLVCWGANVVADDKFSDYERLKEQQDNHIIKFEGLKEFNYVCDDYISATVWNKLFKAKIIKDYNVLYPEGLDNEDIEFTIKYLLHCNKVFFINKYLYNYLQRESSIIVQIGDDKTPELLNSVDINLVGRTNLEELKVILKASKLHIDSEGGLVHMRKALNGGGSVVLFGPTSKEFFGYSSNINIKAEGACTSDCQWLSDKWDSLCIKTMSNNNVCMKAIEPNKVFEQIVKIEKMNSNEIDFEVSHYE